MSRQFHPVADLFPLLTGEALHDLAADIQKNGLREPILHDPEGLIIDGRNRYRACHLAGVEPRFVQWDGEGSIPEVALSLSLNLHRRHFNESQRAMVAARTASLLEKDDFQPRANLPAGRVRSRAGALVNVSSRSVSHAARVLHHGCPKLIALVDTGKLAVSAAARIATLGHDDQEKALAEHERHLKERRTHARVPDLSTPLPRPPLGVFGVLGRDSENDRMLLWIEPRALNLVIQTLEKRGLRCLTR